MNNQTGVKIFANEGESVYLITDVDNTLTTDGFISLVVSHLTDDEAEFFGDSVDEGHVVEAEFDDVEVDKTMTLDEYVTEIKNSYAGNADD